MKEMAVKADEEPIPEPDYELKVKQLAEIEPPPISQTWVYNITKVCSR